MPDISTPKTLQFHTKNPQFNTPISSTPKTLQFHTKKTLSSTHLLVPHRKTLNSSHSSVPHQKNLSSTNPSIEHQKPLSSTNPLVSHQMNCVELGGVLNWGLFGAEKVCSLCETDVLNWGVCVELRGTPRNFIIVNSTKALSVEEEEE